ncbi:MAG: methyl-accepting chemotaxis protein [Alphaproteobacteria bacterium]|nr:methyl-accepting chemotaxis protein [Alphaproteobacteria bacterium]
MLHFLSRFTLATRIYAGFLFLGVYVVLICFGAMFAVGYVHREYTKTNNIIESTRQISVLENKLFDLNRALYFFALKGTDDEKANVEEAFSAFEEKSKEVESYLDISEVREKYKRVLETSLEKYRADMTEMFSLHEKSAEAAEKVNTSAEKASGLLAMLIDETTLPSASFALNGLREQLDAVLKSIDAVSVDNAESQKSLNADFAALKKAQNTAKQAEMINTKQLKTLFVSFNSLEDEINRKLKIDQTLQEKMKIISSIGDENTKDLKDLLAFMARSGMQLLAQAEAGKISLQKMFVFAAALGGVFAVLLSFFSLFGIRYPLTRLIENAQEMARGDRSVLIHFTERDDEVGALAKALAVLLVRLKEMPLLSGGVLRGRQNGTYGSSIAYASVENDIQTTLPTTEAENGDEFAYFGQGVGVDTESQLCQMLFLVQHIDDAAAEMTQKIKQHFSVCRDRLKTLNELMTKIETVVPPENEEDLSVRTEEAKRLEEAFSFYLSQVDEITSLLFRQNTAVEQMTAQMKQMLSFIPKLTEWGRVAGEMIGTVHSLSSEIKILALNASIEAAKTGEKAKSFGTISSDMRHKTQKTADMAEQLTAHLNVIGNDVLQFSEAMNSAGFQMEEIYRCVQQMQTLRDDQEKQIHVSSELLKTMKETMLVLTEKDQEMRRILLPVSEETAQLETALNEQITETEQLLDAFNSSLPVYEEDKGGAEA